MVERVKGLPTEFEVLALRDVEPLTQGSVNVPKARGTDSRQAGSRRAELPRTVVRCIIVGPEVLVAAERRLESGGIDPMILVLAALHSPGIPHKIAPAR